MVKKIKVVDVAPVEAIEEIKKEVQPVEEPQPVEDVKDEEEVVLETEPLEDTKEIKEETNEGIDKSRPLEYINCENCNKKVLMNTYKYSHQKVCKAKPTRPPPPPPPPPPEPKKERPKRAPKPKQNKEEPVETPKPAFNGVVSFNKTCSRSIFRHETGKSIHETAKS